MSKWPLPLACLLVTGCFRSAENIGALAAPEAPSPSPAATPDDSPIAADSFRPVAMERLLPTADFLGDLDHARNEADAETRLLRIAAVFKTWAQSDLAAARRAAAALGDSEERFSAHEGVLAASLERDVREAVDWVLRLQPPTLSAVLLDQAVADWVRVDAAAAGAHVAKLEESDYRTILAGEVARAWVARDAFAAATWGAGLADQEAREEALRVVVGTFTATAPRRAAELALQVPGEGDRATALEIAVEAWFQRDPESVAEWSKQIADERQRAHVARLVDAQREATSAVGK